MNMQNDSLLNTNPDQKEDNKSQLDNDIKSLTHDKNEPEESLPPSQQEPSFRFEPE